MKAKRLQIRKMAGLIAATFGNNSSADWQLHQLRQTIKENEKQHRRGRPQQTPIGLAVDLFTVRVIADAVRTLTVKGCPRKLRKNVPASALCVRLDYLQGLRLVAQHLETLFQTDRAWCKVSPAEFFRVAELCDYTEIVCK